MFCSAGRDFMKKKKPSAMEDIPDLDDMETADDDKLINGGDELVYGL